MGERWARNIRQEIRRNVSRRVRSTSRQWPDSGNGNAAEHPSGRLARQLALRRIWTRNVRTENLRDNSQYSRAAVRAIVNPTSYKQLVGFLAVSF
jgi:hypothetical protein